MLKLGSGAAGLEIGLLELEIPLGGTIGVVDQHEMGIVLQTFRLSFHGLAILLDELGKNELQQLGAERHPPEDIPGGDYVDAALAARNRRDGRQAREPVLPCLDGLPTHVWEREVDGGRDGIGVGVELEQLVGRTVGAGRMRTHAEALRDRLKGLLFLVNGIAAAPPPGLVDKRTVRRVHEADDAVVDTAGQVGGQVGDFVFVAEGGHAWYGKGRIGAASESGSCRDGLGHEHPDEVVVLFTGVAACVDAVDLQFLIGRQRWDELALAAMGLEPPAVVTAFKLGAVEATAGEGHATMRAGVLQGERTSLQIPAEDKRRVEQHRLSQSVVDDAITGQGAVPEAPKHQRIWGLALGGFVEHGDEARVLQSGAIFGKTSLSLQGLNGRDEQKIHRVSVAFLRSVGSKSVQLAPPFAHPDSSKALIK
jgi:hypothetical protein